MPERVPPLVFAAEIVLVLALATAAAAVFLGLPFDTSRDRWNERLRPYADRQRDLAQRSYSDANTVTALLRLLEQKGLVRRERDNQDARALRAYLTPRGRTLQAQLSRESAAMHARLIEAVPEADRLEGVPHPRATAKLYGHEAAERTLAEGLASGRMHHGWLIAGPDGIGKATLAYRFARFVLADGKGEGKGIALAESHAVFRRVASGGHPDFRVLERELGFAAEEARDPDAMLAQGYRGSRYSFGYPACPNLADQQQLLALLRAEEIGITLSEEDQLDPEQSTSAIVVHHPQAKYFSV